MRNRFRETRHFGQAFKEAEQAGKVSRRPRPRRARRAAPPCPGCGSWTALHALDCRADTPIPRSRRMLYRGSGPSDVTDLYEHGEIAAFLAEDAAALRQYIGFHDDGPGLRLVESA
jgi:hypothetical protein